MKRYTIEDCWLAKTTNGRLVVGKPIAVYGDKFIAGETLEEAQIEMDYCTTKNVYPVEEPSLRHFAGKGNNGQIIFEGDFLKGGRNEDGSEMAIAVARRVMVGDDEVAFVPIPIDETKQYVDYVSDWYIPYVVTEAKTKKERYRYVFGNYDVMCHEVSLIDYNRKGGKKQ